MWAGLRPSANLIAACGTAYEIVAHGWARLLADCLRAFRRVAASRFMPQLLHASGGLCKLVYLPELFTIAEATGVVIRNC